ncbi:MAG: hypothetical protein GXO96_11175 [Nitrospirae bacterium]|nr:hypothetical protein [Candidatus Manganitrophaceae bacterium]
MGSGSPIAVMLLFSLLALCAVLFAIPALRSPPPGFSSQKCTKCKFLNHYNAKSCKKCGGTVQALHNETEEGSEDDQN